MTQLKLDMATKPTATPSPRAPDPYALDYREMPFAELVEFLVLDAECARIYAKLQAAGHDRGDKLRRLVEEVRDGVDHDVFERWCALAGVPVPNA